LIDALEGLAMHARDLYSTKVTFAHQVRSKVQIPAELGNHFYRIAQEAVTNAVRHGQAGEINIALSTVRGKVRMSINDDGCGIPLDAVDKPGMGLKIMQHRAQITGGTVRFENQSRGTRVVCESPIEGRRTRARTRKPVISA
jgi:signal transduction histidine kinase